MYLFSTNVTLLTTFTNPTPEDYDEFGSAVAAVKFQKKTIAMNERPDGPTSGCTEPGDSASNSNETSVAPGR